MYNLDDHSTAYSTKYAERMLYQRWDLGPTYGNGHDLKLFAHLKSGYCNLNNAYEGYAADNTRMCRGRDFKVKKLEVWHMVAPVESPETRTDGDNGVFAADPKNGAKQSSDIATQREVAAATFATGLNTEPAMWVRCFKLGVGQSPTQFHDTCDGMGPTMTFARLQGGRRLAAYAPASWTGVNNYLPVRTAMLYSLDSERHSFSTSRPQYGMYDTRNNGPGFGGNGDDLTFASSGKVSCILGNSFYTPSDSLNNWELCANGKNVQDMEVWYLNSSVVPAIIAEYSTGGALVGRSSDVATSVELAEVSTLVGHQLRPNLWMRCYDLATDAPTSQTFHKQCDNLGPTMTLVKLQNGRRIAAYAMHSWDKDKGNYISGSKNVLYSFNEKMHTVSTTDTQYGQYSTNGYGPTFGGGHDLVIRTDMKKLAYCTKHSFAGPLNAHQLCAGGGAVDQLEVYTLGFDATSTAAESSPPPLPPPPPSLPPPPPNCLALVLPQNPS